MVAIIGFEELDKSSLPIVGGKNASLGELLRAGIRVPPGFAITTDSYREFVAAAGIGNEINRLLDEVEPDAVPSLDRASAAIQTLILEAEMPAHIAADIEQHYQALCARCHTENLPVAVRSSATAEDLPDASFAGQQDTYLWVRGLAEVLHRAQHCWASLFTARAIGYRARLNFPPDKVLISVGVQKMVNSRTSGVMFTLNPINGDHSKVVVESSWGFGEAVVSGAVTPDRFAVDKVVREVNERVISAKAIECVYLPGDGVVHNDVSPERQTQPSLHDNELQELVTIAKRIEAHYGCPMDIEWAIDHDLVFPENVFIVQSRPETVWSQRKQDHLLGQKSSYQLLMEKALSQIQVKR